MPSQQQRTIGALLGLHAGDSLGASLEFSSWAEIQQSYPDGLRDIVGGGPFSWPPGHATDDTDMTRAVLLAYAGRKASGATETSLAAVHRDISAAACSSSSSSGLALSLALARDAGDHMLDWYDGRWPDRQPGSQPVDVGGATRTGLKRFRATRDPRRAGAGLGQAGNGSLMRCLPTGLFGRNAGADSRPKILRESTLISAITHNDGRCLLACAAYNAMVHALVLEAASPEEAVAVGLTIVQDDAAMSVMAECLAAGDTKSSPSSAILPAHRHEVQRAIELGRLINVHDVAEKGPQAAAGAREALPHAASGYVLESLTLAVAALLDTGPGRGCLADTLVDVVRVGRDTDTNAAIAGGLLGARDGVDAIPAAWRARLQFADEFTRIVKELVPEDVSQ